MSRNSTPAEAGPPMTGHCVVDHHKKNSDAELKDGNPYMYIYIYIYIYVLSSPRYHKTGDMPTTQHAMALRTYATEFAHCRTSKSPPQ